MASTVDRVLPWRRADLTPDEEVAHVVDAFREHHPRASGDLVVRAYRRARRRPTRARQRKSGDPYISHPVAVAKVTADLGLDDTTIAAALLHDAVEDTRVALEDLEEEFGAEVAAIVDGVTKLERLEFESREAQQAATMRKMLVAMAKDLRVLMIKLADRLHNMRTMAAMPNEKQVRIAQETLDIYAPLAHRLGVAGGQAAAGGPRLRRPAPEALRRDRPPGRRPGPRAGPLPDPGRGRGHRAAGRGAGRRPRSPAARSTSGASTRRWSCGARSSTTSTTSSASG